MARLTIELPADLGGEDRLRSEGRDRLTDDRSTNVTVQKRRGPNGEESADEPLIQRWMGCWAGV